MLSVDVFVKNDIEKDGQSTCADRKRCSKPMSVFSQVFQNTNTFDTIGILFCVIEEVIVL